MTASLPEQIARLRGACYDVTTDALGSDDAPVSASTLMRLLDEITLSQQAEYERGLAEGRLGALDILNDCDGDLDFAIFKLKALIPAKGDK